MLEELGRKDPEWLERFSKGAWLQAQGGNLTGFSSVFPHLSLVG